MQQPAQDKPVTPERIGQFAWGYAIPLIIEASIRHRIFDAVDSGTNTVEQVAQKTNCSTRGVRMLLNALVGVDLAAKDAQGRYSLTPESSTFLVTTKPSFQGGIFKHVSTQLMPKWMQIEQVVRTGKPASTFNDKASGERFFEELVEDIFPMSYGAAKKLAEHLN